MKLSFSNLVASILLAPLSLAHASLLKVTSVDQIASIMEEMNIRLGSEGVDYRVALAELYTSDVENQGITVLAKDVGNKKLDSQFVQGDPRRTWNPSPWNPKPSDINYAVDRSSFGSPSDESLDLEETVDAIDAAMLTWDGVQCSSLTIEKAKVPQGLDVGFLEWFILPVGTGTPFVFGDIQHSGFGIDLDGFLEVDGILGVAFSFVFFDGDGNPTDINGDGYVDKAFVDIYYNGNRAWHNDGTTNVDLESVAVHEAGHAFGLAHFGQVSVDQNGNLERSPEGVMNAIYAGPFRELQGQDKAGFCGLYDSW